MMASPLQAEVRKLRKKLRQIENLEHLQRQLTESEMDKVSQRAKIRTTLALLLSHVPEGTNEPMLCHNSTLLYASYQESVVYDQQTETQDLKRSLSEDSSSSVALTPVGITKERQCSPMKQPKMCQAIVNAPSSASTVQAQESGKIRPPKVNNHPTDSKDQKTWQDVGFQVRHLQGHCDLITAVLFFGSRVISGSRDTTIKVWHVPTSTQEKNLAGHTGGITCLAAITVKHSADLAAEFECQATEQFVASGSVDCFIILWALQKGAAVQKIYTFCGVSALIIVADSGFLVSGSDGGKVEVWNPRTKEILQSKRAHVDAVTALKEQAGFLYSGSADGSVKVWRLLIDSRLQLIYNTQHMIPSVRCIAVSGDHVYFGTDGVNIKVLTWRTGTLSRLHNHVAESGFVDALCATEDNLLIATGFDIDHGHGYLNLRSLEDGSYRGTLSSLEAPRLFCLDSWCTPSGLHRWVTGGKELLVWEQLPAGIKDRSTLKVMYFPAFEGKAAESESFESDSSSGEEGIEPDHFLGGAGEQSFRPGEARQGWSWCLLL